MNIHDVYSVIFNIWRPRRWRRFQAEISPGLNDDMIDIGGTVSFWKPLSRSFHSLVIVNLDPSSLDEPPGPGISVETADGCSLPYRDGQFSIAFSNSVIEHVGNWDRQRRFASECRRVAARLWIQTPAREFPIEPHFIGPFIHWMPIRFRPKLVRWFSIRGLLNYSEVRHLTEPDAIRLLSLNEMKELFPDCSIHIERFLGIPKSYIAVRKSAN